MKKIAILCRRMVNRHLLWVTCSERQRGGRDSQVRQSRDLLVDAGHAATEYWGDEATVSTDTRAYQTGHRRRSQPPQRTRYRPIRNLLHKNDTAKISQVFHTLLYATIAFTNIHLFYDVYLMEHTNCLCLLLLLLFIGIVCSIFSFLFFFIPTLSYSLFSVLLDGVWLSRIKRITYLLTVYVIMIRPGAHYEFFLLHVPTVWIVVWCAVLDSRLILVTECVYHLY